MKTNSESADFFSTLGRLAGSQQQENQLSRTFQACFKVSPGFRRAVLQRIASACGANVDLAGDWHCATEQAAPNGGRLDITISCDLAHQPIFVLESKVGSPLKIEQLKRYRSRRKNGTTRHLIAITKYRPEVPLRELTADGIRSLRWQGIHRALVNGVWCSSVDRFIASAFVEFLEEGDMAFAEQLTLKRLKRASQAVRAMHRPNASAGVREAFHALHACTGLVQELGVGLREDRPALADFRRYGPLVVLEPIENGQEWNFIVTGYWRGRRYTDRSFGWGIGFNTTSPRIEWSVWRVIKGLELEDRYPIKKFLVDGRLDEHRPLDSLREHARKWKICQFESASRSSHAED